MYRPTPTLDAVIELTWAIMPHVWKLNPCQSIGIILEYCRSCEFNYELSHIMLSVLMFVLHAKVNINLKWYSVHDQNGCLYFLDI